MSHETSIARRPVQITNKLGLHMRPINKFVQLASQYESEIRVHFKGNECNGKSILEMLTLSADCGSRLDLEARGADASAAIEALAELVKAQFNEVEEEEEKEEKEAKS